MEPDEDKKSRLLQRAILHLDAHFACEQDIVRKAQAVTGRTLAIENSALQKLRQDIRECLDAEIPRMSNEQEY